MLRVLHLTAGSDAGGLSRYIFDLSSAMQSRGDRIAIAGQHGAWKWLFDRAPFPWIDVPLKGGPIALSRAANTLRDYLKENPVDVLHTHYRRATLVARKLQKTLNVPIVYTSHLSGISLAWPWRKLTDFGDFSHAASEEVRQWLIHAGGFPAEKIFLIPHGIDPEKFPRADAVERSQARASLGLSDEDLVAAYVGRLDFPKNEEWMLDLAAASREALPNLKIIMAGEGPHEDAVRNRIARENLGDRVRMLGHHDPLPVYQAADALLLPSMREGFSLVCAEAMAVGTPVFRCRTAGTEALVIENVTGRSVPIDRDEFVRGAIEYLRDKDALSRMGEAGARLVRERFTFDQQLRGTISMYDRAIELYRSDSLIPSPGTPGEG